MPEFKYVKYADRPEPADPVAAKLDQDVDTMVYAPQLNSVLCCGRTVHAFNLRNHRVEKSAKVRAVQLIGACSAKDWGGSHITGLRRS